MALNVLYKNTTFGIGRYSKIRTDLCSHVVLVVPGRSTTDPYTAVGAFAVTPDSGYRAGCADGAAALWVAAAAAADGVRRWRWGRCAAAGTTLQTGDIQGGRAPWLQEWNYVCSQNI